MSSERAGEPTLASSSSGEPPRLSIGRAGYMTAHVEPYARAMTSLCREFGAEVLPAL